MPHPAQASGPPSISEMIKLSRMQFAGVLSLTLGYGIYLVIAAASLRLLKRRPSSSGRNITLAYTVLMLVFTSASCGTVIKMNTVLLVDSVYDRSRLAALSCSPTAIFANAMIAVQIFGSDSLLLYRTYVILEGNWWFMVLPCLMHLAILGIGITVNLLCASTRHGGPLSLPNQTSLLTVLYSLTVAFNILTTLLIGVKLLLYRSRVLHTGARKHDTLRDLTSVVGILVESAALYSLTGIVYIAFFVRRDPLSRPLSHLFVVAMFISPALIILRVASGAAYERGAEHSHATSRTLRTAESGEPPASRVRHAAAGPRASIAESSVESPYGHEKQPGASSAPSESAYEMLDSPLTPNRRSDFCQ